MFSTFKIQEFKTHALHKKGEGGNHYQKSEFK